MIGSETHLLKGLTERIIKCYYEVYNSFRFGFLEKVYENSLRMELIAANHTVVQQPQVRVHYKGICVGEYFADLIVDDKVIVEVKAVDYLRDEHRFQLLNYLRCSDIQVGLLLNFGIKPEIKRVIFRNPKKRNLRRSA